MKIYVFLAEGFEEIEAIAPIDIFRRADIEVVTVSVSGEKAVCGAHGITIIADTVFEDTTFIGDYLLFLPGGMPGTLNLEQHQGLRNLILQQAEQRKEIAAICAAPSVLGKLGLLKGKKAVCYPGFEKNLYEAELCEQKLIKSDNIYTAKAAGASISFALKIVEDIKGVDQSQHIAKAIFWD